MTRRDVLALTWVALALTIVVLDVVLPPEFGPYALGAIFEPYLVVSGLIAGLVVVRTPRLAGRVLVVALLAVALARYVPVWVSSPAPPSPATLALRVATWNMLAGTDAAARASQGVSASNAQLIAIQELGLDAATALGHDTRFPYKALPQTDAAPGVGLLSVYPILETQSSNYPQFLRAVIDLPMSDPLVVYVVHAPLGRFVTVGDIPVGVDLSIRDPALTLIRMRVDEDLAQNRSVIILGDLNTTERERAYAGLSAGLRDAHLDAGVGPGFTWRPSPLALLPFGMLRIDYVLSTPDLVATSSTVDCSLPSDHCRLDVELVMSRSPVSAHGPTSGNGYFSPAAVLNRTTRSAPER